MFGKKPGPEKGAKYKRRKKPTEKQCEICGRKFPGVLARGRFCSARCRNTAAKRRKRSSK